MNANDNLWVITSHKTDFAPRLTSTTQRILDFLAGIER